MIDNGLDCDDDSKGRGSGVYLCLCVSGKVRGCAGAIVFFFCLQQRCDDDAVDPIQVQPVQPSCLAACVCVCILSLSIEPVRSVLGLVIVCMWVKVRSVRREDEGDADMNSPSFFSILTVSVTFIPLLLLLLSCSTFLFVLSNDAHGCCGGCCESQDPGFVGEISRNSKISEERKMRGKKKGPGRDRPLACKSCNFYASLYPSLFHSFNLPRGKKEGGWADAIRWRWNDWHSFSCKWPKVAEKWKTKMKEKRVEGKGGGGEAQ